MSFCLPCLKNLVPHVLRLTLQCHAERLKMWFLSRFYSWVLFEGSPCILPVLLCPSAGRFGDIIWKTASALNIKSGNTDSENICMYGYPNIDTLPFQSFSLREKEKKSWKRYPAVYGSPEINIVSRLVL